MANRYWVGGSGNWSDAANKWSDSSGGSPNASFLPTANDDVYFDAASNGAGTGAFTVTVDGTSASPSLCASFLTGGAGGALDGAMTLTMGATARLNCNGSMTLPATNLSVSGTTGALITFVSTTSQTLTTNGVSLGNVSVTVDGVAGTLTLGSALTCSLITVTNGTFDTSVSNYNVTATTLSSNNSNVRTINLNGSTVTLTATTAINFSNTNLTFNAGTSTVNCSAASPSFGVGGQTFYNVSFTSNATGNSTTINGANTYNNLTQTSVNATGIRTVTLGANQTVNGALTLGAANTAIRRIRVVSGTVGTQYTITLNGSLAALADVDFRDIVTAGTVTRPWTGTRLGDCKNNSGITFATPKTVYWNLAGSQNWSATAWATTNNGVPDVNNFPLAQDTATFTEAGAAGTITYDANWQIGSIQMADGVSNRTTAFTLATGTTSPGIYGNVTLFSGLTFTGTGAISFVGQGVTQTFTSAGLTLTQPITVTNVTGTLQLQDNLTLGSTLYTVLTSGTLNLNNNTLTTGFFESVNSNTRSIAFGTTGNITVTANAATVFDILTATNFTYTGTSNINSTYSGSTGTRTIRIGYTGGSIANAMNVNVSAGSDTITLTGYWKNVSFIGFSGALNNSGTGRNISGNLTFSTGMTLNAGTAATVFDGVSGTQQITTAGKTLDFPVTFNGVGGTFQLQDNMTVGSTRTVTLANGTLDLTGNSGNWTLSTGNFNSSTNTARTIAFGTGNITITGNAATVWNTATTTNLTTSGSKTVNFTYSGSTGTRTIQAWGSAANAELYAFNLNISAGSDTVFLGSGYYQNNINFSGFSGTLSNTIQSGIYGNVTFSTGMTLTAGANAWTFAGTSGTQQITTNGKTLDFPIIFNGVGGTFQLQDNMTVGSTRSTTLTNGTLDLTGNSGNWTLSTGLFISSNSNARTIKFGTGNITLTSNNTTVWGMGTATSFTYTGTPTVNATYSGSTGTRTIQHGSTAGATESNSPSINFSAGSDTLSFQGGWKNVNFTGFAGTISGQARTIYGNLTVSTGMTIPVTGQITTFAGTSGPYTITTNGKTLDFPVTFDGIGGTWTMADALTLGSTRALTMTNGTLQLKAGTTNTVGSFATSGTNLKYLTSTVAGSQATLSDASGTNNVSYLSIKDNVATGGAGWDAFTSNGNIDAGNNVGWVFDPAPPDVNIEYYMELRSFTEPRRF